MDDLFRCQQEEIETLRERLRQALAALAPMEFFPPVEWGLTASEARIFAHLRARPIATKQSLMSAVYGDWIGDVPDENTLESHISRLRRKIARYGFKIKGERFMGYHLVSAAHG